jgi:hypothetical protein
VTDSRATGVRWPRLAGSALIAIALGVLGFAAFVQSIHDPTPFHTLVENIGLPLFELGARVGVFWIAIAGSVLLWTAVLYLAATLYAGKKT